MLAAIYGPFQTVGRLLEMAFGHKFDARITGMLPFSGCQSHFLAQQDSLAFAVAAMMIFGMGHGVLTYVLWLRHQHVLQRGCLWPGKRLDHHPARNWHRHWP